MATSLPRNTTSRKSRVAFHFPLCLILLLLCLNFSSVAAGDNGVTFYYPLGGETFYYLDYVNVTYESAFSLANLFTFCRVNGNVKQVREQTAEPNNGSVLVYMNFTTNVPCWFDLRPGETAGLGASTEPWSLLARENVQTTWGASPTATAGGSISTSTPLTHASNGDSQNTTTTGGPNTQMKDEMSGGAKAGIGFGIAVSLISLGVMAFAFWDRRRRRKRAVAKDMINFVDGDIVNLVDGGRFEKKTKPDGSYSPYQGSHTSAPSGCQGDYAQGEYSQGPWYSQPPVDRQGAYSSEASYSGAGNYADQGNHAGQGGHYGGQGNYNAQQEYAHLTQAMPTMPGGLSGPEIGDNASWANDGRHPYSPPGYDAESPASEWSVQPEHDFYAAPRGEPSSTDELYGSGTPPSRSVNPVEALPAILPDNKAMAELPARDGYHGYGHEQELPAPSQEPQRRQGPPMGLDDAEQKFLLSDMLPFMKKKQQGRDPGPAG